MPGSREERTGGLVGAGRALEGRRRGEEHVVGARAEVLREAVQRIAHACRRMHQATEKRDRLQVEVALELADIAYSLRATAQAHVGADATHYLGYCSSFE